MHGRTASYASSEHAYQALRSLNLATAREFELGGSITMEVFRTWPVGKGVIKDIYEQKQAYWGERRCRGIAPKMISNLSPGVAKQVFGLDLSAHESREGSLEAELLIWRPILVAKFTQHLPMLSVLKDTAPALLVEAGRFPNPSQYWSAYLEKAENKLIGKNMMGRILTTVREELLHPDE
jgi:predicted NAD-dependent protein-ADP-ribosyltransferase YbiA (DUF1768 family)